MVTLQARPAGALGTILTDGRGMTLYTFDGDAPGASACVDGCAAAWPPLEVAWGDAIRHDGLPGPVSVITRPDGRQQVAYQDRPLYLYAGDAQPGDTNGYGLGGVWRVVVIAPPVP